MGKEKGNRASLIPKEQVPKAAVGRVTRRSSMMLGRVTPIETVPIQQPHQKKKSVAEILLQNANNLAEKEVLSPTRNEHTSSRAVGREVVLPEPRRALSFNMTEIAEMCNEDPGDDDAQSESACGMATFRGCKVSHEVVPVLQKIFDKYGDITKESVSHDPKFLSFLLEELGRTVEMLKSMMVHELSSHLLEKLCGNIKAMEKMNLNVGWLQKKLSDIKEVKDMFMNYPAWKEEKSEIEKERAELAAKQREILALKERVEAKEDRYKESSSARIERANEIFKETYQNNCAHGLL